MTAKDGRVSSCCVHLIKQLIDRVQMTDGDPVLQPLMVAPSANSSRSLRRLLGGRTSPRVEFVEQQLCRVGHDAESYEITCTAPI
jgi:hypothetical protein